MKLLTLKPEMHKFNSVKEFCQEFKVGKGDLIITNEFIYKPSFEELNLESNVIFQEKYEPGEPSDDMVEAMYNDIKDIEYKRVIGVGGGSVLDASKLFALKDISPVLDLFDKKVDAVKAKELILVPTTCGTGSEVTNIAILALISRNTKMGLATNELYADYAVMVPKLLESLPFKPFAHSAIDALIHATESVLSPRATAYTNIFAYEAIRMIIDGFRRIAEDGEDYRKQELLEKLLYASNYAGIAFGNSGVGLVHAMSYPIGGKYHVPHGESNYLLFTEIFKNYTKANPDGQIKVLNQALAEILGCDISQVYDKLEELLDKLIQRKKLREYGMTESDLDDFVENVVTKQTRLTQNSYVQFSPEEIRKIYEVLF